MVNIPHIMIKWRYIAIKQWLDTKLHQFRNDTLIQRFFKRSIHRLFLYGFLYQF